MSSWQKTVPKRGKVKRSDKSVLAVAEKSHKTQEPSKLSHITTKRTAGPPGRKRKPPSRRPMETRTTKLRSSSICIPEDVSLVANKKEAPKGLSGPTAAVRPVLDEKDKEIKTIERNKRMSCVQTVGKKSVMRIFLDNNGIAFKTVGVTDDCTMYELVEIMRKKLFTDTTGFGIWEVRDKLDVALIKPTETIGEIMKYWDDTKLFKFVFKKALGENAKLYYKMPNSVIKTNSFGGPMGSAPKPLIRVSSGPTHQSSPYPETGISTTQQEDGNSNQNSSPPSSSSPSVGRRKPPSLSKSNTPTAKRPPPSLSGSPTKETPISVSPTMPSKPNRPAMPNKNISSNTSSPSMPSKPTMPNKPKVTESAAKQEEMNEDSKTSRRTPPCLPGKVTKDASPLRGRPAGPPRGGVVRRGSPQRGVGTAGPGRGVPTRGRGVPARGRGGSRIGGTNRGGPPRNNAASDMALATEPKPQATESITQTKPQETRTGPPKQQAQQGENTAATAATTTKRLDITEWSVEEVAEWVADLGFGAVKNIFVENYISGKELVDLTNEELKEDLGVKALGARKGILRKIQELNT